MASQNDNLKLRLAARTLIEWRTPVASDLYQRVLNDLIAVHPCAMVFGLQASSDVIKADDRGILLFYLSETLNETAQDSGSIASMGKAREFVIDYSNLFWDRFLSESVEYMLTTSALRSSDNESIWEGGPTKVKFADSVISALNTEREDAFSAAYEALVVAILPVRARIKEDGYRELVSEVKAVTPITQMLVNLTKHSRNLIVLAQAAGTLIVLTNLAISQNTRTAIGMSFGKLLTFVGLPAAKIGSWQLVLPFVLGGMSAILTGTKRYRELIRSVMARLVASRSQRLVRVSERLRELRIGEKLFILLVRRCSAKPDVFRAFLEFPHIPQNDETISWEVLSKIGSAKREVIKEALQGLINPDVTNTRRALVFRWICRVSIAD